MIIQLTENENFYEINAELEMYNTINLSILNKFGVQSICLRYGLHLCPDVHTRASTFYISRSPVSTDLSPPCRPYVLIALYGSQKVFQRQKELWMVLDHPTRFRTSRIREITVRAEEILCR